MSRIGTLFINTGIALSVLGAIILGAGLIANSLEASGGASISFGGVIMIGPIPIVFGTDRTAILIAAIGAVILMAISLAFFFLPTKRTMRQRLDTVSFGDSDPLSLG